MGKYVKVYLTDLECDGIEELQARRRKAGKGENSSVNGIMKESLVNQLLEEGVMREKAGINKPIISVVKRNV